jgi:SNF2 family DNA or RNA helicase
MVVTLIDPSTKLNELEEIISDNPTKQLVVFSQSRSMVNLLARRLESKKISVGRYTGQIPQKDRDATVEAFQRGDLHIFAGTIAAGGEGITLHASSTCVFLDRHWNPTKNVQAEDRLHRIGQKNAVQIIDIMARNTVDLGRRTRIARKWANIKLLLGDTVDPKKYEETVGDSYLSEF